MEGKALPALSAVGLILVLPLLIVLAMLLTSMGSLGQAAECTPTTSSGAAFGWPTEQHEVSQGYAEENPKHTGVDFAVAKGSKVMAAEDGTVIDTSGDWIKIKHSDDAVQTWYQFFESKSVRVGDTVTRGQEIGKSGAGDEAEPGLDGEHLHFELRIRSGAEGRGALLPEDPTDQLGDDSTESSGDCGCGGPLVGSNNQQKAFNFFTANGYSKEQAAGIVGNMIHESGVEPARLQNTPSGQVTHAKAAVDSPLGWGIVQWTPAGKMIRPSLTATNGDEAKVESLEWQLEFLKKQLDGDPPLPEGGAGQQLRATKSVADAAVAFGRYFERFAGSEDLSNPRYAQRKTAAQQVFDHFSGAPGAVGGTDGAAGGCGAGNGDIVQTAMALSWPDRDESRGPNKEDARPSYQEAMPKYNGATTFYPYTDCGVFVATVMVMSGVDKDYQRRGTGSQRDYVKGSPKYETFDNFTDISQLKPGDILVNDGHTFIYTGPFKDPAGKTWTAMSASLETGSGYGRVPQPSQTVLQDGNGKYTVARIKK
ncbi:peptidase M23 [Kribbella sp. ALI-6-A]|uniref:phage tail tip lysozyme n=1 Tax=Kribbella sp. ALI-6-A TaxID=1933817 RepID=UPI00097C2E26|nr:phage tail tip lysozyme [Kribbella sp. ALI-6-A]ONI67991.1 peptidase M23 [Kribbella sp. ALI-6-A]